MRLMSLRGSWRHAVHVIAKLWRVTDTRLQLSTLLVLLAVDFAELGLAAAKPCMMSSRLYSEECGDTVFWIFAVIVPLKGIVGLWVIPYVTMEKTNYAAKSQLAALIPKSIAPPASICCWPAASAEDVFHEIVKITASSQMWLLFYTAIAVFIPAIAHILTDVAVMRSPEYQDFLARTCSDTSGWFNACRLAWGWKSVMFCCISCFASYQNGMTLLLRLEMLGPVFVQAMKEKKIRWLNRCLWLHWANLPYMFLIIPAIVFGIKINIRVATASEMMALTWICATMVISCAVMVAWTLDLDGALCGIVAKLGRISNPVNPRGRIVPELAVSKEAGTRCPSRPSPTPRKILGDLSFSHRQAQILACATMLMVLTVIGSWKALAAVWAIRAIMILAVLSTDGSTQSTLEDLERSDPCFGLLIDADHLKEALRLYRTSSCAYTGPLRRVRGTYYRMEHTLAISYRWNMRDVEVCQGLRLNMSDWQLHELEKGIIASGCLYVWIDRVALPQKKCKLQTTLLARMMAIYATSKATLALRSQETEGNRYHQRAWTLQEYCNAKKLIIVTQPAIGCPTSSDGESLLAAVAGDEAELLPAVREWHLARTGQCRPYWLAGFSLDRGSGEVLEAMNMFTELADRLICLYPEDKIRALYPMLFNTPCEDQTELAGLVADVANHLSSVASPSMQRNFDRDQVIIRRLSVGGALIDGVGPDVSIPQAWQE